MAEISDESPRTILIAAADLHISPGAWAGRDVRGDSYYALEQLVDAALREDCPLALAGDVFDVDDPDPGSVRVVVSQLARLVDRDSFIPVYEINGQHDRRGDGRWMALAPGAIHLPEGPGLRIPSRFAEVHGRLRGVDWMPPGRLAGWLAGLREAWGDWLDDPANVLVMHQVWREYVGFEGSAEASLADVPGRCTIVTGDFHGTDNAKRRLEAGGHLVLSPGSTCLQSIDETPEKGYWALWELPDGDWEWHWQPLRCRGVIRCRADSEIAAGEVRDFLAGRLADERERTNGWEDLPEALRKPVVAVWHWDDEPGAGEAARQFGDVAHVFVKARDRRRAEAAAAQAGLRPGAFRGLLDALDAVVPAGDPRRGDLERLLAASDAGRELAAVKAAFFEKVGGA